MAALLSLEGPYGPTKEVKDEDLTQEVPKSRREYDEDKKEQKSVVLKVSQNDSSDDEEEMTYLTTSFQILVKIM